jgi:archaellum biogenesis protein FlaJ (TadC family)
MSIITRQASVAAHERTEITTVSAARLTALTLGTISVGLLLAAVAAVLDGHWHLATTFTVSGAAILATAGVVAAHDTVKIHKRDR